MQYHAQCNVYVCINGLCIVSINDRQLSMKYYYYYYSMCDSMILLLCVMANIIIINQ